MGIKYALWNVRHEIEYMFKKRDKSVVLFGAWFGKRFSDTARVMFQYVSAHKEELGLSHVVWVTRQESVCDELRDMGYEAYMMDSEESIHYHKTAGTHIICNSDAYEDESIQGDIMTQYSNGALKVNLWHAAGGIKACGFMTNAYKRSQSSQSWLFRLKESLSSTALCRRFYSKIGGWGHCYYVMPSTYAAETIRDYFRIHKSRMIVAPYPRDYSEAKLTKGEELIIDKLDCKKKKILYLPTFRTSSTVDVDVKLDETWIKMLEANNILWIQKEHGAFKKGEDKEVIGDNIITLRSDFDINTIISKVDLVVTDYSSVVMDAAYYDVPVAFYVPDYEEYKNGDNGFYMKPEDFLIGEALYSAQELYDFVNENYADFAKTTKDNAKAFKELIWSEGMGCKKTWDEIRKLM